MSLTTFTSNRQTAGGIVISDQLTTISDGAEHYRPDLLSTQETLRLEQYNRRNQYATPPDPVDEKDGLYYTNLPGGQQCLAHDKDMRETIVSIFNFIPTLISVDISAFIRGFNIKGISVTGPFAKPKTKTLHALLEGTAGDGSFVKFVKDLAETGEAMGDAYIGVGWHPELNKPYYEVLDPRIVFPRLNGINQKKAEFFKISFNYEGTEKDFSNLEDLNHFSNRYTFTRFINARQIVEYRQKRGDPSPTMTSSTVLNYPFSPVIHIANKSDKSVYFGLPLAHNMYGNVDKMNTMMAAEMERFHWFGAPQILAKNIYKENQVDMEFDTRHVHYMPPDGNLELMSHRSDPNIRHSIQFVLEAIQQHAPQYVILKLFETKSEHSGQALMVRAEPFRAHILALYAQYEPAIKELCRSLMILDGEWNDRNSIEINWGSILPEDNIREKREAFYDRRLGIKSLREVCNDLSIDYDVMQAEMKVEREAILEESIEKQQYIASKYPAYNEAGNVIPGAMSIIGEQLFAQYLRDLCPKNLGETDITRAFRQADETGGQR